MSQTLETATSIIRVDLPAVKRNVERIRRHIGPDTEIMYVAKSNGYGNGIVEPAVFLKRECGIRCFAASQIGEAIDLREAGIDDFLMVLSAVPFPLCRSLWSWGLWLPSMTKAFRGHSLRRRCGRAELSRCISRLIRACTELALPQESPWRI